MSEVHWFTATQVAEHEAAHAVAAQEMGLPVAWVTVDPGSDEGIQFGAAVKIPDDLIDRERDLLAICVSLAAPSHLVSHRDHPVGRYAQLEYQLALEMAGRGGIQAAEVYDHSSLIVSEFYEEIVGLARRLMADGTVTFDIGVTA